VKIKTAGFLFLVGLPVQAAGIPEIVVTANRLETPQEEIATSATVISRREIERSQKTRVSELLAEVPGVSVLGSGGAGRMTSVSIRGTDPRHTLVLVDGVEMNDALSTTRTFDFGNLSLQDVERIEVVRGSQSTLYGSDAIGGVIHVITKKGSGKFRGNVEAEYGTYDSYRLQASAGAGTPKFHYHLGAGRKATGGFPAADRNLGNTLDSGSGQTTVSGKAGGELAARSSWEASARFSDAAFDQAATGGPPGYDGFGNRTGEDPGWKATSRELSTRVAAKTVPAGIWRTEVALSHARNQRTSTHEPNALDPKDTRYSYDSQRIRGSFQNDLLFSEEYTLSVGLESFTEAGSSSELYTSAGPDTGLKDRRATAHGAFVQNQWVSQAFFATGGLRFDTHRDQGSRWTYRLAPGFRVKESGTTLRASAGTGFKVPSLYQRYSSYGDPSLSPELSFALDAGIDQELGRDLQISLTGFRTDFSRLIDYDFVRNRYATIGRALSQGIEAGGTWSAARFTKLRASYTYTRAIDEATRNPLLRKPLHQLSLEAARELSDRAEISAQGRFVGGRDDLDAVTARRVRMPGFAVFDLRARYRITSGLEAFGRIENLLDRQYQEVNGFGTAGRSLFVGARQEI
jgi:vitamin B12 transporter